MHEIYVTDPQLLGRPTAVALGFFDGVHKGHAAVVKQAVAGQKEGLVPCVFSFTMDAKRPGGKQNSGLLCTRTIKRQQLLKLGAQMLYVPAFEEFCAFSAEEFVRSILVDTLHARMVCCGEDYRFGQNAAGDVHTLQTLCQNFGIVVKVVPSVEYKGQVVHSTAIRKALAGGNLALANHMLGRFYNFDFEVIHGRKLGRTIGSPTLNQAFSKQYQVPRFGVYASFAKIGGQCLAAVTNIGIKPTVGSDQTLAETYIFDFSGDLYGQHVEVCLVEFLRPEQKFASIDALKEQINRDKQRAQELVTQALQGPLHQK